MENFWRRYRDLIIRLFNRASVVQIILKQLAKCLGKVPARDPFASLSMTETQINVADCNNRKLKMNKEKNIFQ